MKKRNKEKQRRLEKIKSKNLRDIKIIYYYTQTKYSNNKIAKLINTTPSIVSYVCSKFRR